MNELNKPRHSENISDSGSVDENRGQWSNQLQFLMSCIAMSVGLGNVWRFPYVAYSNGGGAFLIPYLIILMLVGKPLYFMEIAIGQFSSRGSVKVYDFCPAMRGVGGGAAIAVSCVMSYYSALIAIIAYYLIASFSTTLPWTICDPKWANCYSSSSDDKTENLNRSSSDYYLTKTVLRETNNIDNGIGLPEWKLTMCLFSTWLSVFLALIRGVKNSGKYSYFLALFPYVIMLVLLVRAVTLPGASEGILYFVKPNFKVILEPKVWFAAVTQCFFSLSVCFGSVIMYASYNTFRQNVFRDAMIVTTLDTVTSLISGFTIFGILGNLSQETGLSVETVVTGGADLAFISYPMAISKFDNVPQLFAVLFFLMLFILGLGSMNALTSCIVTATKDRFHWIPTWVVVTSVTLGGFSISTIYITPGGQFMLNLVDHHGASFIIYFLGISELITLVWIYGIRNLCDDFEFMLRRKIGIFLRLCWKLITPGMLIAIFIYSIVEMKQLTYKGIQYPTIALVCGWILTAVGILQIPLYAILAYYRRRTLPRKPGEKILLMFTERDDWGPLDKDIRQEWLRNREAKAAERAGREGLSKCRRFYNNLFGY